MDEKIYTVSVFKDGYWESYADRAFCTKLETAKKLRDELVQIYMDEEYNSFIEEVRIGLFELMANAFDNLEMADDVENEVICLAKQSDGSIIKTKKKHFYSE